MKCKIEGKVAVLYDPVGSATQAETVTEQSEVAFVPTSERQHTTPGVADTIITVGHRGQKKKRKRNLASNEMEDGANMFGYTEPSLLDACDVREVGPLTKKRNKGRFNRFCK